MMDKSWLKKGMLHANTKARAPVVDVMASQCDAARQEPPELAEPRRVEDDAGGDLRTRAGGRAGGRGF